MKKLDGSLGVQYNACADYLWVAHVAFERFELRGLGLVFILGLDSQGSFNPLNATVGKP